MLMETRWGWAQGWGRRKVEEHRCADGQSPQLPSSGHIADLDAGDPEGRNDGGSPDSPPVLKEDSRSPLQRQKTMIQIIDHPEETQDGRAALQTSLPVPWARCSITDAGLMPSEGAPPPVL